MIKQPYLICLAGLGLIVAAYFAFNTWLFLRRAVETQATVSHISSYQSRCGGGRRKRSYPCTKFNAHLSFFVPQHGEANLKVGAGSCRSYSASCRTDYNVNQKVPVLYDPKKPARARVNSLMGVWSSSIGSLIGALISALGSLFEPRKRRAMPKFQ